MSDALVLRSATLIDGTGADPRPAATLLTEAREHERCRRHRVAGLKAGRAGKGSAGGSVLEGPQGEDGLLGYRPWGADREIAKKAARGGWPTQAR